MSFPDLIAPLASALSARGYAEPTPVQAAVLAPELETRDLLVSAQTGSGKTVAFGLALAPTLLGGAERFGPVTQPLALVVAPTRELAMQVQAELSWLYEQTGARIATCIGGTDARREARTLAHGAHIVVGTPGRLCDHLSRGALKLGGLRAVVLDEADEMLDLGFREELEKLLDAAPADRRTLLFSATIAREIASLAKRFQRDAQRIDTVSGAKQHSDISYRCVLTAPDQLGRGLVNLLRFYESPTAMVFCNTRAMVATVQAALLERGFTSVAISGEMGQNERSRAIEMLRSGQARVCVATDVAARGIDIPALSLVVHASIPSEAATLLHRSGRTGRAGRKGTSVLMVPLNARRRAERLLQNAKIQATWESVPTADAIAEQDATRLLEDPALTEAAPDSADTLISTLTERFDAATLASALVRLYRARLPQTEDVRPVTVEQPRGSYGDSPRAPREPRTFADEGLGGSWYRLSVGRDERADPKWLVPLICRLGGVKKREIGAIRIEGDHSLFEIASESVDKFNACVAAMDADEVRIEAAAAPAGGSGAPVRRSRPSSAGGPGGRSGPRGAAPGAGRKPFKGQASSRKRRF
ncbi:DEAD/DEAH box helicase [Tanticharoenia sakaeratensis]|uniref:ATP-dependent RNA helicase n=1 Tax=Tanticharoenia sakaeratensis NBRC 103193 TaxID=1231623 RepID=A0A0D6MGE7_9PROT|nr:DEAD/DEAH box helicase [Tanticharoenia sakaeratensis]GAN52712.1 ATP-dependent RNA helicase [Tanticharoenia sakaeratensis NBRC 103193]GBQ24318.1 DNA/RNA helicase [Tanticharoenia sakaeratensis NBRC 103193]